MRQALLKRERGPVRLRGRIDLIDDMVLLLLAEREELVREVGVWKKQHRRPVMDLRREKAIMARRLAVAKVAGLDPGFIRDLYAVVFRHARTIQRVP
jgi:chorismate mutase